MTDFKVGQRVYIIPIDEGGVITNIRRDNLGSLLYDVVRDGGFDQTHICREQELAWGI